MSMSRAKPFDIRVLIHRMKTRISDLNTNAATVSRQAKLNGTAVHDILSGRNRNPSLASIVAIARILGCQIGYLIGDEDLPEAKKPTLIPISVIGIVEAGAFRPVSDPGPDHEAGLPQISAPRNERYPMARHFALQVWGDSMNAAKPVAILQGMYVLCVDVIDAQLTIESGQIYVVRRTKDGGQTYELTLKRARVFQDRIELVPESSNPRHLPIVVPLDFDNDATNEIAAIGWVYGTYSPMEA